jgi:hypothetical protein
LCSASIAVDLGLTHQLAQRLGQPDPQLRRDRPDRPEPRLVPTLFSHRMLTNLIHVLLQQEIPGREVEALQLFRSSTGCGDVFDVGLAEQGSGGLRFGREVEWLEFAGLSPRVDQQRCPRPPDRRL